MKSLTINAVSLNVLLFKTDVNSWENVNQLRLLLGTHPDIAKWSVDTEDRDRVLRIVPNGTLHEQEIIQIITSNGFACEVLTD